MSETSTTRPATKQRPSTSKAAKPPLSAKHKLPIEYAMQKQDVPTFLVQKPTSYRKNAESIDIQSEGKLELQ